MCTEALLGGDFFDTVRLLIFSPPPNSVSVHVYSEIKINVHRSAVRWGFFDTVSLLIFAPPPNSASVQVYLCGLEINLHRGAVRWGINYLKSKISPPYSASVHIFSVLCRFFFKIQPMGKP